VTEPSIYTVSMMFLTPTLNLKNTGKKQKNKKINKKNRKKKTKKQM